MTVQSGRRTINPSDVYQALEILELPFFLPRLKAEVSQFNKASDSKKQPKSQQPPKDSPRTAAEDAAATEPEDEDGNEEDYDPALGKGRAKKKAKSSSGKSTEIVSFYSWELSYI